MQEFLNLIIDTIKNEEMIIDEMSILGYYE
jgi:hypothetical protein